MKFVAGLITGVVLVFSLGASSFDWWAWKQNTDKKLNEVEKLAKRAIRESAPAIPGGVTPQQMRDYRRRYFIEEPGRHAPETVVR